MKLRPPLKSIAQRLRLIAAPALIFATLMALTMGLRSISMRLIDLDLTTANEEKCRGVINVLQSSLIERMTLMRQLASFFSGTEPLSAEQFERESSFFLDEAGEVVALIATDVTGQPLFATQLDTEIPLTWETIQGIGRSPLMAGPIERGQLLGEYGVSEQFTVPGLGQVFAVAVPFGTTTARRGFIIGLFVQERLLESHLRPGILGQFNVELKQGDIDVFRSYLASADERPVEGVEDFFYVGPKVWRIKVESAQVTSTGARLIGWTTMGLGLVLAFLVSAFVFMQQYRAAKFQKDAWISRSRLVTTGTTLAHIQENLSLILNNVNECVILYDAQFAPVQANSAFKNAFRAGLAAHRLDPSADEHHEAMAQFFEQQETYWKLLDHLKSSPEEAVEGELRTPGNQGRFYHWRGTSVCAPDGAKRGYLVIYQDVTPARTVEKLKDDFLASVTHDLRSPLSAIKGFAETIHSDDGMGQETRREFASIIRDESEKLEKMIEDLLDIGRMEEGRVELMPASYRLVDVLEDVVRSSHPLLEVKDLKVEYDWECRKDVDLFGDLAKMSRAFRNILTNAIKYSPPGSVIRISVRKAEEGIEIDFSDQGPGVPEEDLPHIFEKFYRGSLHLRRTQGTGLGLAIVRHIVEAHGGHVSVVKSDGTGLTLRLTLPRFAFDEDTNPKISIGEVSSPA